MSDLTPGRLNLVLAVFTIAIGTAALLTPNGIIIIVENPAFRVVFGVIALALGAAVLFGQRRRG